MEVYLIEDDTSSRRSAEIIRAQLFRSYLIRFQIIRLDPILKMVCSEHSGGSTGIPLIQAGFHVFIVFDGTCGDKQ